MASYRLGPPDWGDDEPEKAWRSHPANLEPGGRPTSSRSSGSFALHHFEDLDAFGREAARVLRPGGRLYLFDLATPEDTAAAETIDGIERLRDPSHVASHPSSRWRTALGKAGLRTLHLEAVTSEFPLEPWLARAGMPPEREAEARRALDDNRGSLGGYGLAEDGRMRVLRVEIVAKR